MFQIFMRDVNTSLHMLTLKKLKKFCKKQKIELPYDPAISLLGIYPKELKAEFQRDICIPRPIAALFA